MPVDQAILDNLKAECERLKDVCDIPAEAYIEDVTLLVAEVERLKRIADIRLADEANILGRCREIEKERDAARAEVERLQEEFSRKVAEVPGPGEPISSTVVSG